MAPFGGWASLFNWARRTPAPLTGVPPRRRVKTYSSANGYVYQYVFAGRRDGRRGSEYLFTVSCGPGQPFEWIIEVPGEALAAWERANHRTLIAAEKYAVAKLSLLAAFDESSAPGAGSRRSVVDAARVTGIFQQLDPSEPD